MVRGGEAGVGFFRCRGRHRDVGREVGEVLPRALVLSGRPPRAGRAERAVVGGDGVGVRAHRLDLFDRGLEGDCVLKGVPFFALRRALFGRLKEVVVNPSVSPRHDGGLARPLPADVVRRQEAHAGTNAVEVGFRFRAIGYSPGPVRLAAGGVAAEGCAPGVDHCARQLRGRCGHGELGPLSGGQRVADAEGVRAQVGAARGRLLDRAVRVDRVLGGSGVREPGVVVLRLAEVFAVGVGRLGRDAQVVFGRRLGFGDSSDLVPLDVAQAGPGLRVQDLGPDVGVLVVGPLVGGDVAAQGQLEVAL